MRLDFLLFELLMYALLLWVLRDAARQGRWRVLEVLAACLYGLLLEWATLKQLHAYSYGDFVLMLDGAPLAIGAGWAIILYSAMELSDRLTLPERLRPLAAGLFALSIDLAMDAIAIRRGFWTWGDTPLDADWFGVPWGNFWAWLIVVSSFSFALGWLRQSAWAAGGYQRWIYPLLAIAASLAVLLPTNALMKWYLDPRGWDFAAMALLIGTALALVLAARPRIRQGVPTPRVIAAVPLTFHAYFFALGLLGGYFFTHPVLGLTAITLMVLSVALHAWLRRGAAL
jgi:hypothetical protein